MPRAEFLELQQHWYQKLAEHGFKDIEKLRGEELVLEQTCMAHLRNGDELTNAARTQYFRSLGHAVNDESAEFRNDIDRFILERRAEGVPVKTIGAELEAMGHYRHRHSIRFIIRRYEVAWGIKQYRPSQLNMKRKA